MKNTIILTYLLNLFDFTYSKIIEPCEHLTNKILCLESPFCAWCNDTVFTPNYTCIYKNTCDVKNLNSTTNCEFSENYKSTCKLIIVTINMCVIFIFLVSMLYLIDLTSQVIYNNFNNNNNLREGKIIMGIIMCLIIIPGIYLWVTLNSAFLFYMLFIISLSLCQCCLINRNKYKKYIKKNNKTYEQIN